MKGEDAKGKNHQWLRDNLSHERYDLAFYEFTTDEEIQSVYKTGTVKGYYGFDKMPASHFFGLFQKAQSKSKRWSADNFRKTPNSFYEFFMERPYESLF